MLKNEGAKNWGLVIFVLFATSVFYLFLIFSDRIKTASIETLESDIEELRIENLRLTREVIYLQDKLK